MSETKMNRYHFYLPERQAKHLEKLKEQTGLSVAELIRRAIDLLFSEYAEKPYLTDESGIISN
jgi:hypothetical protein